MNKTIKLDKEQRHRASLLEEWVMENPEEAAHELIYWRDQESDKGNSIPKPLLPAVNSVMHDISPGELKRAIQYILMSEPVYRNSKDYWSMVTPEDIYNSIIERISDGRF